ncbi:MAG: DUF5914 domain-containing protein [Candidatus Phosphoribacter sp.]|nr:Rieske 2Fe-2S domain-containing protein [Actinomycetales bacterium]
MALRLTPPDGWRSPVRYSPQTPPERLSGTWHQARPARIHAALAAALARDPGGWLVCGTSAEVRADRSMMRVVAGQEIVLWRDTDGNLRAGGGACPHLGASLGGCDVVAGRLLCPWHGLALGDRPRRDWPTYAAHDDGVLVWARLPLPGEKTTDAPTLPARPPRHQSIAGIVTHPVTCEPRDIIANRLDPWHGAWLHPYAFSDLSVDESESTVDRLVLDVSFRLGRHFAVPVRAEFACPDARTICMTILDGEGLGSIVETHATPITAPGRHPARTVMTEVTVATSARPGFQAARAFSRLVAAGIRRTASQLWVDDLTYAARTYELRRRAAASANDASR